MDNNTKLLIDNVIKELETVVRVEQKGKSLCTDNQVNDLKLTDESKAVIKHLIVMELESNGNKMGTVSLVEVITEEQFNVVREHISNGALPEEECSTPSDIAIHIHQTGILAISDKKTGKLHILEKLLPDLEALECISIDNACDAQGVGMHQFQSELVRIVKNYGKDDSITKYLESI